MSRRSARIVVRESAARGRSVRAPSSQLVRGIDDQEDAQHRNTGRHELVRASRALQGLRENAETQSRDGKKQSCSHAPDRSGGLFDFLFHTAPVYSRYLNGIGRRRRIYLQSFHYSREIIRIPLVIFPIKFCRARSSAQSRNYASIEAWRVEKRRGGGRQQTPTTARTGPPGKTPSITDGFLPTILPINAPSAIKYRPRHCRQRVSEHISAPIRAIRIPLTRIVVCRTHGEGDGNGRLAGAPVAVRLRMRPRSR